MSSLACARAGSWPARTCGCCARTCRHPALPRRQPPCGTDASRAARPPQGGLFPGSFRPRARTSPAAPELAALSGLLDQPQLAAGTVVISAIGGMAGVGKTALAVRFAHQVAGRFPDGQLYVNLRGFGPSGPPATPGQALRGFLDALAVPAERVPRDLDARAGLYRSLLAGMRMLIVLDNARDAAQVRPLLPGARLLDLDVLSPGEARDLLAARLGVGRVTAEPGPVAEIISLCGRLPLALAIVAARAAARPGFPLSVLAAELHQGPLDALAAGGDDPAADARAVLSWYYRALSPQAARLFRLLGLPPGPGHLRAGRRQPGRRAAGPGPTPAGRAGRRAPDQRARSRPVRPARPAPRLRRRAGPQGRRRRPAPRRHRPPA
jgi:hypothetical protein